MVVVSTLSTDVTSLLNGRVERAPLSDRPIEDSVDEWSAELDAAALVVTLPACDVASTVLVVLGVAIAVCEDADGDGVVECMNGLAVAVEGKIVVVSGGIDEKLHRLLSDSKSIILMFRHSRGSLQ